MPFFRRRSNGFQVVIDRHLIENAWVIFCLIDDEIVGLAASTLNEAIDSLTASPLRAMCASATTIVRNGNY